MRVRAYIDESGSKGSGNWMVLAALVVPAELLDGLVEEWELALRATHPGRVAYFKMDEAMHLRGEFADWQKENRDAKVRQMATVINRADLLEVSAIISIPASKAVADDWRHVPQKHSLNQPYIALVQNVVSALVLEAVDAGASALEIVLDENQAYKAALQQMFPLVTEVFADMPAALKVIPDQLWFRDDRDDVLIQAADLLAGQMRLVAEANNERHPLWGICNQLPVSKYFREVDIAGASEGLKALLDRTPKRLPPQ